MLGATQETHHPDCGSVCSAGAERLPAPTGSGLSVGDLGVFARHRGRRHRRSHRLACLQVLSFPGKMVEKIKEWAMTRHKIEHICWLEVSWQRPFELEDTWKLSPTSRRSALAGR